VYFINKYIGTYRVFPTLTLDGELSKNLDDLYLLGKYKIQVYRHDKNTLAIYFLNNQTVNNIIPQLKELGINIELYLEGDFESIYHFKECEIEKVNKIVKFQTKGKGIQAKSVKTKRKLQKLNDKEINNKIDKNKM